MRVFKTKWFARYARKEGLADNRLVEAIREMESGLVDADYGGGLIKKRIARDGEGKSGGYRNIIAYKANTRCVFLYCYAKNNKDNLSREEVAQYKEAVAVYLGFDEAQLAIAIDNREMEEVLYK